jgi:Uma2 family endonuclease
MTQPLLDDPYVLDPEDPRAPTQAQWERMSLEQRERVAAMLSPDIPLDLAPPEGDAHFEAKAAARSTLGSFFRRTGRKIYVSSELTTYYPDEQRFAPDVLAVLDVEPHHRTRWIVQKEGKGLDFVLEVHVAGDASKDHEKNVERYARLGIREYFLFDRGRLRLHGYRLPDGQGARSYQRLVPQAGRFTSQVLGLDLALEGPKLRFYFGEAALPEADELIARLGSMLDEVLVHKEEAERHAAALEEKLEAEQQARKAEQQAREAVEQELAEARAEIERLKGR